MIWKHSILYFFRKENSVLPTKTYIIDTLSDTPPECKQFRTYFWPKSITQLAVQSRLWCYCPNVISAKRYIFCDLAEWHYAHWIRNRFWVHIYVHRSIATIVFDFNQCYISQNVFILVRSNFRYVLWTLIPISSWMEIGLIHGIHRMNVVQIELFNIKIFRIACSLCQIKMLLMFIKWSADT